MDSNFMNDDQPTNAQPSNNLPPQPIEPYPSPAPTLASEAPVPDSAVMSDPVPVAAVPQTPQTAPQALPQPAPQDSGQTTTARKILLVEDDDALANVYLTRLQAEGFDVKRVPNGEDALSTTLQFHPDLILLDVMMPKVSGFDVLDILRNTPETTNIKVIMLTALSQDSDKARAQQLGADDYLVKSQVVIADVVDRIKHHLGMS